MIQFLKSENSRVDAFIDTKTGKILYGAKGHKNLRTSIEDAEADAATTSCLKPDAPALPDSETKPAKKPIAR